MLFTDIVHEVIALAEEADRAWGVPETAGHPPFEECPRPRPEAYYRLGGYLDALPADVVDRLEVLMYRGRDPYWRREPRRSKRQQREAARKPPPEKGPLVGQLLTKGHNLPVYLRRGVERAQAEGLDLDSPW